MQNTGTLFPSVFYYWVFIFKRIDWIFLGKNMYFTNNIVHQVNGCRLFEIDTGEKLSKKM